MALIKEGSVKCYLHRRSPSCATQTLACGILDKVRPPNTLAIRGQKPGTAAEHLIMSASAVGVTQSGVEGEKEGTQPHDWQERTYSKRCTKMERAQPYRGQTGVSDIQKNGPQALLGSSHDQKPYCIFAYNAYFTFFLIASTCEWGLQQTSVLSNHHKSNITSVDMTRCAA